MNAADIPIWRFMYASRDEEEERAFRQYFLEDDLKQCIAILYLGCGFMLTLTVVDLPNLVRDPALLVGASFRIIMLTAGLLLVWIMKKRKLPSTIDVGAMTYSTILVIGILLFHLINEPSAVRIAMVVTLLIFVLNIAFSAYAVYTLIPIMIIAGGDAFIFYLTDRPDLVLYRNAIVTVYVASALMAAFSSAHLQRARYHAFDAFRQVKTLSGLLPICAGCKKVRNDDGLYEQIENYIEAHSEAQFSHGLCPECVTELYPELESESSQSVG